MNALKAEVVISPSGSLDVLSQQEVAKLMDAGHGGVHDLLRRCSLAVLNCGGEIDDARQVFRMFRNFEIVETYREHYRALPVARTGFKAILYRFIFRPLYNLLPESFAKRFAYKYSVVAVKPAAD